jgi:DNA-binding CsgD family transcriptional regulator
MTREERAIAILDLMNQAMAVISEGDDAEQLVCQVLGKAAKADGAALIGLDAANHPSPHASWPNDRISAALADVAGRGGRSRPETILRGGQHPILGEVVLIGPDLDEQPANRARSRLLVLSRRGGFTPDAKALLAEAAAPLSFLMPQAADACQRARQTNNAAEAAAALNLTPREVEVLRLLADGLLARTIATRLGLSPRTVHKHLSNVYTKLGVHDRLVAVSIAREHGLIAA